MLEYVFTAVLNMSITASVAAALIILFRWIFGNRLPRVFSYALWAIVLFRLLIPFSFQSVFSVFNVLPVNEAIISENSQNHEIVADLLDNADYGGLYQGKNADDVLSDANGINEASPSSTPGAPADPKQVMTLIVSFLWLAGAAGMLLFNIATYLSVSHRLKEAVLYKNDDLIASCSRMLKSKRQVMIYTSDRVHTPVVCGLVKARIILPLDIAQSCSELELRHIITHELVHIKRFDYLLKPLSMLALSVHWFNPLMWLAFRLSQKDMEMSCDQKAMSVFENDIRSEYAASLIKLASRQNVLFNGGLLAFGESSIKSRIKGIMSFRKPGFWVAAAAVIILLAAGLVLLTNGQDAKAVLEDNTVSGTGTSLDPGVRFGIYLIKNAVTKTASELDINDLELEDTPVITDRDLEYYNWDDHTFETKEDFAEKIGRVPVSGIPFVIVANGERIYLGAFWASYSSLSTTLPVIDVILGEPYKISQGYPGKFEDSPDLRNDKRIFNALEAAGKLLPVTKTSGTDIEMLLEEIMKNGPQIYSNPYDYIKDNKAFDELVAMGQPAADAMMDLFEKSNEDGLKEYIMAAACAKIMGVFDAESGIGTSSGREWFYKYGTFEKNAGFQVVDADYELFEDTASKPEIVLPAHTDLKNIEDVISKSILTVNRRFYSKGEKALEAHKIYGTEEKDGVESVYMLASFHWFGFENGIFTTVAGGSGQPVKLRLKKNENGEYQVLEYRSAMDGGLWEESIREMFPKEQAEAVIQDVIGKKTAQELLDKQFLEAKSYLEEIGREDVQVMQQVSKDRGPDKAARRAIYQVYMMRHEFPEWNGTREILVLTGGKAPGMKVRCTLQTRCEKIKDDEYTIVLTKTWDIKINGIQPVSYWKYKVTGDRVELTEEQDNDSGIKIIK